MVDQEQKELSRYSTFRDLAAKLEGLDHEVYQRFGRDPLDPVLGKGERRARIAVFGRDPGRDEVRYHVPFIGAGGQLVRNALYHCLFDREPPDFDSSIQVGSYMYWANTVPYKPVGNKAWPLKVKKQFQPLIADLLVNGWEGKDVITLGRDAFFWFGIDENSLPRQILDDHWRGEDRFERSLKVQLTAPNGNTKELNLHPLPHPSPLNAAYFRRFPSMMRTRLKQLNFNLNNWRLPHLKA